MIRMKQFESHFVFFFRWNELGGCVVSTGRLQVLKYTSLVHSYSDVGQQSQRTVNHFT